MQARSLTLARLCICAGLDGQQHACRLAHAGRYALALAAWRHAQHCALVTAFEHYCNTLQHTTGASSLCSKSTPREHVNFQGTSLFFSEPQLSGVTLCEKAHSSPAHLPLRYNTLQVCEDTLHKSRHIHA